MRRPNPRTVVTHAAINSHRYRHQNESHAVSDPKAPWEFWLKYDAYGDTEFAPEITRGVSTKVDAL